MGCIFFRVASYPVIARLYNGCDREAATPKNRAPPRRLDSIGKLMPRILNLIGRLNEGTFNF